MLHCDLRVRWKVASDLQFWAAISEPEALFNKLKTTPTPNRNGSYGIKGGGFVCHTFWGPYAVFSVEILTDFYAIGTPMVWLILGASFLQI